VERGAYGAYAQALAEMLRYGGVPMNDVFARTRLRVNEITHGAFTPWDMSKLTSPLVLFAADSDAQVLDALEAYSDLQGESIHDFTNATDAYAAAAELDTLASYQEFLAAFPSDPLCARVQALLARRREALTWSQARRVHRPNAYWSYMQRYPDGPHAADAQRLLIALSAQVQPPARFEPFDFQGLPPPAEEERGILEQGDFGRGGPHYAPVPPLSLRFLPPLPQQFRHLPPPEERAQGQLPVPLPIPLAYARPAARLGNLAAPNFQPQPPAEPVAPEHAAGHALPNPNERLGNERLGNERSGNTRLGNERTGEEPTHAASPRVEVRPPPKAPPSGHFEVAPHPAAPIRPAGEAR
jgi:hypothetical protein